MEPTTCTSGSCHNDGALCISYFVSHVLYAVAVDRNKYNSQAFFSLLGLGQVSLVGVDFYNWFID